MNSQKLIWIITIMSVIVCFQQTQSAKASNLALNAQTVRAGTEVTVTISIDTAPNDIKSFGFDILYNSDLMKYKSGSSAQSFTHFNLNELLPGQIRVGGFDNPAPIQQGFTGEFVFLTFEVVNPGLCEMKFMNLEDDLNGWSIANMQFFISDAYETDDHYPQSGVLDRLRHHNFHDAGDEDWVMIYGMSGKSYTIMTSNHGNLCDTVIEIYDVDGTTLLSSKNDEGAGKGETLLWVCLKDNIYFVKVKSYNPDIFGANTEYDLYCEYPGGDDAYEPDDNYEKAHDIIVNGDSQRHMFLTQGDEDWNRFYAVSGETYTIETINSEPGCDTVIELYVVDKNQKQRDSNDLSLIISADNNVAGEDETINWTCETSGIYYLKIKNKSDTYGANTKYDVRVKNTKNKLPGKISGTVKRICNDKPIFNVIVKASCTDSQDDTFESFTFESCTNEAGVYSLDSLPESCTLTAIKCGTAIIECDNDCKVEFTKDNEDISINIKMEFNGDINGDGKPTPSDAKNAFEKYMGVCSSDDCNVICCDVNCDGACTPSDALCIFQKYLTKPSCLDYLDSTDVCK